MPVLTYTFREKQAKLTAMDRDQLLDKTKKALRSLLISAPRGVVVHLLAKDYNMVMGKELPYRELGYRSLDDFINSIPDTIRLGHGPGGLTCYAVANAETQQIARFVALQKKPALKKSLRPPAIVSKPTKMSGFSKKNHFGPAHSRTKKYTGGGGGGAWSNSSSSRQYVPAGYRPGGGGGSKYGKPFHTKPMSGKWACMEVQNSGISGALVQFGCCHHSILHVYRFIRQSWLLSSQYPTCTCRFIRPPCN